MIIIYDSHSYETKKTVRKRNLEKKGEKNWREKSEITNLKFLGLGFYYGISIITITL